MSTLASPSGDPTFRAPGGEMGALIRAHDWAATPLGPMKGWPQGLKVAVRLLLNTHHPMFIWWGPELIQFYNDAYAGSLGPEKHPAALGARGRDTWPEIWDVIGPQIEQVMTGGEATWHEDQLVPIIRHGERRPVWWTYGFSPIDDPEAPHGVGGVLVIVRETTREVVARRDADERYRALFDAIESGFCAVEVDLDAPGGRVDYRVVEANPAFYEQTGFPKAILGRWLREAAPALEEHWYETYGRVARTGEPERFEQGSESLGRWFDVYAFRMGDPQERRVAILFTDMSARRNAELALRESEARFRNMADHAPVMVWTTEPDGRCTYLNRAWYEFTGQTEEEAMGLGWLDATHPDDKAEAERVFLEANAERRAFRLEYRLRRADGTYRWAIDAAAPRFDAGGAFQGYVGSVIDIDERREAEARLRALTGSVPAFVWFATPDGRLHFLNDRWYEYTGQTPEEALPDGWTATLHPDDAERTAGIWADARARGVTYEVEVRYRRRDGTYRWYVARAEPLRDAAGAVTGWIGTSLDIHDRKLAEDALRGLNVRLEQRVEKALAERLREQARLADAEEALRQAQKMEAIGQLTGGVAHDFNNLLTVIRSSADLLRRRELTEDKRRRYVDAISDTADRAARLTGQLLAFSRRQALTPEVFDAAARVESVAEMLRTVVGSRIELLVERRCAPCFLEADANQFETALVNMAVNARDAMDGEGRLVIAIDEAASLPALRGDAGTDQPFVAVSVSDTGAGIAPGDLQRIFEPFFTTKEVGRGTGLGLSQVYGFAKQSGGDVAVASRPGEGAVFTLYLPRVPAPAITEAGEGQVQPAPAGQGRVLVVEDNAAVGEFATQLLDDLGYETELASNAAEALDLLDRDGHRFDLVFSDVVMPGMGGVDLGRRIRERRPDLPVVLTSGYSHVLADDARHGFALLRKPYSVDELSRVLRDARAKAA